MAWHDDIPNRIFPARGPLRAGLQLRVLQAGHGHIDGWWDLARVIQPHWVLYRNHSAGTVVELAGGRRVPLDPAYAWLLPPWLAYGRCTRRVGHLWVHFDVVGPLSSWLDRAFAQPMPLRPDRRLDTACAALRRSVASTGREGLAALIDAQTVALSGLAIAIGGLSETERAGLLPASGNDVLRPAFERIDADPAAELPNAELAAACGLSLARFARLFSQRTGRSPHQYLIDRRLGLACSLLLDGELTIDEVAAASGFADRFAFSHVFTRRIGRTPAAYRDGRDGTGRRSPDPAVPVSVLAPTRARCSPRSRDHRTR